MLVADRALWKGKRVLITGHTGFKGSWLSLWLTSLGADVTGLALPAAEPSLFVRARISEKLCHVEGDIRDLSLVQRTFDDFRPEVVFHLAAQSLVRLSYDQPVATFGTNVMGTVNVLEAARWLGGVAAFVCVTSDKCYEIRGRNTPCRESDPLGGDDPYSASKGAAEIIVSSYRKAYFPKNAIQTGGMALSSVRAGNVIGGGDWAVDRLIPDLVRAYQEGHPPHIRAPNAVRPWQHVLEPLNGYLLLAERLIRRDALCAKAWNFGPDLQEAPTVSQVTEMFARCWGEGAILPVVIADSSRPEASQILLDSSMARNELCWIPRLTVEEALRWAADWYRAAARGCDPQEITLRQIHAHSEL